ncbi:MAG: hypothetical protein LAT51_07405, partial [Flavobacteriaceae bacterium]|nr:hypothetical protein [Flavobacteriaceae bacterium]
MKSKLQRSTREEEFKQHQLIAINEQDEFDFIALMLCKICETKTSIISLMFNDEHWLVSEYGKTENKIPKFFFRPKAIKASKQIQIFNNINDDKRFKNHSLTAFYSKSTFYVESPLVSSTGHVYGYLHTIHDHFHDLSNQQIK